MPTAHPTGPPHLPGAPLPTCHPAASPLVCGPHPKSTPSTPCPAQSPVAATPRSPAISPSPSQMPKTVESQEREWKGSHHKTILNPWSLVRSYSPLHINIRNAMQCFYLLTWKHFVCLSVKRLSAICVVVHSRFVSLS